MIEKLNQFERDSFVKNSINANIDELETFIRDYLNDHHYFKPKDISLNFLKNKRNLTFSNYSPYELLIQNLTRKIGKLLGPYKISGAIQKFNSITYQVIK